MGQFTGKVVLITGANQGLGKGLALRFAAAGAALGICARNADKLKAVSDELIASGAHVLSSAMDVTEEQAVEDWVDAVHERFGRIDLLINNAGAFDGGPFEQLSLAAWDNVIGACLTGTFLCSRAAFRIMKAQGGGRIINIGSISAQRARENSAPYTAAKFGVWGLTQSIALDGRPYGITCGALHPGNILVERRQGTGLASDEEPMMSVDSVVEVALLMAQLPPDVNLLESIVLPSGQMYIGRG